jgi:hypothetical protein
MNGSFRRFHENGEVAQEGEFVDGEPHGTRHWYASTAATTEVMHAEGLSPLVRQSEIDYVRGCVVAIRLHDADGHRVAPTGERYPDRPGDVYPGAEFRPDEQQWTFGQTTPETGERIGQWQVWASDGQLIEEASYVDGLREGPARFFITVGERVFRDGLVRGEQGEFHLGFPTGTWQLVDARGAVLGVVDYGSTDAALELKLPAYSNATNRDWASLAEEHLKNGEIIPSLCARVRECAARRSPDRLLAAIEKVARPLTSEAATRTLSETPTTLADLAISLVRGAPPAPVLCLMATALDQRGQARAALDFVNAALLVEPAVASGLFTRAQILMSLGLKAQAERDAVDLAASSPEQAEYLLDVLRIVFPSFGFWPADVQPETYYADLPDKPVRSLEEVRLAIQKYAMRLSLIRSALLDLVTPDAPWLPPDVTDLLPDELVTLEVARFEENDESTGVPFVVHLDERPKTERADLIGLQRMARAEWNALVWLCWSAGMTEVGLPERLTPPENFGQAAGMASQRRWRSHDQRLTNGSNAQAQNVPGFEWEGLKIDDLHPDLAGIAEEQYDELRALFLWLSDTSIRSPWQDDLHGS